VLRIGVAGNHCLASRPCRSVSPPDREITAITDWTPTLADVQAARGFMRRLGLTRALADQWERLAREIEKKIAAGTPLTRSDKFWLQWWMPSPARKTALTYH
jgi:hypothetical protein